MRLPPPVAALSSAVVLAFAPPAQDPPHVLHWNVAVLVFEGVELLDFAGPVETFTQTRGFDPPMTVYTVGPTREPARTNNVVCVVPDWSIADCPPPDILVIPGGETRELSGTDRSRASSARRRRRCRSRSACATAPSVSPRTVSSTDSRHTLLDSGYPNNRTCRTR